MTLNTDIQAQLDAMIGKIDELESRAKLRDLVTDYCLGFDNHDWDRFISIWHADAIWEIGEPFGTFRNHDGIREAVFDVLYPVWRETHHLCSNLSLRFQDPDHASGICNVDCMGATKDNIVQMISATYTDDFERRDNIWKIAKRQVKIHYFNPIPEAEMTVPAG